MRIKSKHHGLQPVLVLELHQPAQYFLVPQVHAVKSANGNNGGTFDAEIARILNGQHPAKLLNLLPFFRPEAFSDHSTVQKPPKLLRII